VLSWCTPAIALDPRLDVSQYGHTSWKIRDGFAKGPVRSIAQTSDGYLWLATELGLLRFDGVRAVPWQPPANQSLPSSDIWTVLGTRDGALWIGTAKGLARWKSGALTRYPQLDNRIVMEILEARDGIVWASGTAVPAGILCAIRDESVTCTGEDGQFGFGVWGMYEDRRGNLWAAAREGLWRWYPAPPAFFRLPGRSDAFQGFLDDPEGDFLITTDSGIRRFAGGRLESGFPGPAGRARTIRILRDRDGAVWAGTRADGILHIVGEKTDAFAQADGLSANSVSALFEDREGNIWVATAEGLDRFRAPAVVSLTSKQGLTNAGVNTIRATADGSVLISTGIGLQRWTGSRWEPVRGRNLPAGGVGGMFVDDRARTWIVTGSGMGYVEDGTFVMIDPSVRAVRSIVQDAHGNVWITDQERGLLRVSPDDQVEQTSWTALGHQDFATAMAVDRARDGLWLGFWDGGIAFFKDGRIRETFHTKDGLGQGRIASIGFAPDGSLRVASEGGLSLLHSGRVSTLTSKHGLPCDAVHWFIDDDLGFVWLNTACGLVRVERAELTAWMANQNRSITALMFDSADGVRLQAMPAGYDPYVTKTRDGRLWFARQIGIDILDPHRVPFNSLPPAVHIEGIIADRKAYEASGGVDGHLSLPSLTRDIQIDYTALSLVAPEKMRFRYKLEGQDREWQDVGTRRQAFYNDLPPRQYRFRVLASNNSGVWNETGAVLDFSIAPAYYQTMWFRLSVIGTVLLALMALYRLRMKMLAERFNLRMEERVNERTRIARELHDTLLQSFQGALLKFQAITYQIADRPEAKRTLEKVIEQATNAIVEGRDAVQGLRSSTMAGHDLGRAISLLSEELARDHSGDAPPACSVQVEGAPRELAPLVHDDVYRIAAEALRNAFRHAGARHIEVEIRYGHRVFRLRIRDDGKGIDPKVLAEKGRVGHYGLAGMRERADLVKGTLTIWSKRDSGTETELVVPAATAYPPKG
jgi:signal transduction histidine kinase/ligand-binding sensor domain-containing protein